MNIIFTDIDGVLNPKLTKVWSPRCINVYNRICEDFDLHPVITSTWRIRYNLSQLQAIFLRQGITAEIYDRTPNLRMDRGLEIYQWLRKNDFDRYVVIDDRVKTILPYVSNVISCDGWIGLTEDHYKKIEALWLKK